MGLELDEIDWGDYCPLCFPAGESPDFIMASFSGIKRGNLMPPPAGSLPNKIYKLFHVGDTCQWAFQNLEWRIIYFTQLNWSGLSVQYVPGLLPCFLSIILQECIFAFGNDDLTPENSWWYGGNGSLWWTPETDPNSLVSQAEAVGLEADATIRADFWPDGNTDVIRYVDHKTNSRIKIIRET